MKKIIYGILLTLGAFTIIGVNAQQADHVRVPVVLDSTDTCVIPKVDGERVPFPLEKANTKFELAEGETYLLNGTLTEMNGKVYLQVDFLSQPYLATAKLTAFPYFEMAAMDPNTICQYTGKIVQVAVVTSRDHSSAHNASLELSNILPPVALHQ